VKSTTRTARTLVTADGIGIVSHAGAALLRELADESGLTAGWTAALLDTYQGAPVHLPGRVLTDLAVTLADGGDCLADLAALRDQVALFGPVASHPIDAPIDWQAVSTRSSCWLAGCRAV